MEAGIAALPRQLCCVMVLTRFVDGLVEKIYSLAKENQLIANYLYEINAHVGSGEYAMQDLSEHALWERAGIFAHTLFRRVATDSRKKQSVPTFLYGDHDWLSEDITLCHCSETAANLKQF